MLRWPPALLLGGAATYLANMFVFRELYLTDLKELKLVPKYTSLDLDADMMRQDLDRMGVKIPGVYFEREQVEETVN